MQSSNSIFTSLAHQPLPAIPDGAEVMTAMVEVPPGDPGTPPHRHSGPVYGYVTSFLHVDDAAAAAVAALGWPSGAVNVCDDEPAAARDWVPAFCASVGAAPPPVSDGPRRAWARGADNRRARERLGWTPEHQSWRHGFAFTGAAP